MQSSMLGESNRRTKMVTFRELDNGEVLMHITFAQRTPCGDGCGGT